MARTIIAGLDVGTSLVQVVVARDVAERGLEVLGSGKARTEGMRRGAVIDIHDVAESIKRAIEDARRTTGVVVDHAYVSFGGTGLGALTAKGVVAVARADGEIAGSDIERALASARTALLLPPNREVIHELPVSFSVDKEPNLKNPIGMIGTRLEAQVMFVTAFTPHLKNLIKSVELAGIDIDDVVAAPLASSRAVLSKHQKEVGVMALDLGGGSASLCVYEEGSPVSAAVVPVGLNHATHDIAIAFQTPLDVAERMKLDYGTLAMGSLGKREAIRLTEYMPGTSQVITKKDLAEIIEARCKDIFELVDKHLKKIGRSGLLPSGVVLVGGGANLSGVAEFARKELSLPAMIGVPEGIRASQEYLTNPSWVVGLGLCLWGYDEEVAGSHGHGRYARNEFTKRILEWIKPFIP